MSFLRPALTWQEILTIRKEMRRAGAVSVASALPESALPDVVRADLERLVETGVIRADVPGAYYLSEARLSALLRAQVLKAATFWFLVIIIPVIILQLSNSGAPRSP